MKRKIRKQRRGLNLPSPEEVVRSQQSSSWGKKSPNSGRRKPRKPSLDDYDRMDS